VSEKFIIRNVAIKSQTKNKTITGRGNQMGIEKLNPKYNKNNIDTTRIINEIITVSDSGEMVNYSWTDKGNLKGLNNDVVHLIATTYRWSIDQLRDVVDQI
jgi:hypothetical protein